MDICLGLDAFAMKKNESNAKVISLLQQEMMPSRNFFRLPNTFVLIQNNYLLGLGYRTVENYIVHIVRKLAKMSLIRLGCFSLAFSNDLCRKYASLLGEDFIFDIIDPEII